MTSLDSWLATGGCRGLENLRIASSVSDDGDTSGLGCFAKKSFQVGDILFTVPQSCIFSLAGSVSFPLASALRVYADSVKMADLLSAELLIWLEMCLQKTNTSSKFHTYLNSLSSEEPTIASWSTELQSCFEATNLGSMVGAAAATRLQEQCRLLQSFRDELGRNDNGKYSELLSELSVQAFDGINMVSLQWARGHYLSRRYPDKYAVVAPSARREREAFATAREADFGNIGALVPLLDILNHRPEKQWLSFNVTDDELQVVCNHPVDEGAELYSNYGTLSNETLLYTYGFAMEDNPYDFVAAKLNVGGSSEMHYIRLGGLEGVPQALWRVLAHAGSAAPPSHKRKREEEEHETDLGDEKPPRLGVTVMGQFVGADEIEMMHEFIERKHSRFMDSEIRCQQILQEIIERNDGDSVKARYISTYREGQDSILSVLSNDLDRTLDAIEEENDLEPSSSSEEDNESEEGEEESEEEEY